MNKVSACILALMVLCLMAGCGSGGGRSMMSPVMEDQPKPAPEPSAQPAPLFGNVGRNAPPPPEGSLDPPQEPPQEGNSQDSQGQDEQR